MGARDAGSVGSWGTWPPDANVAVWGARLLFTNVTLSPGRISPGGRAEGEDVGVLGGGAHLVGPGGGAVGVGGLLGGGLGELLLGRPALLQPLVQLAVGPLVDVGLGVDRGAVAHHRDRAGHERVDDADVAVLTGGGEREHERRRRRRAQGQQTRVHQGLPVVGRDRRRAGGEEGLALGALRGRGRLARREERDAVGLRPGEPPLDGGAGLDRDGPGRNSVTAMLGSCWSLRPARTLTWDGPVVGGRRFVLVVAAGAEEHDRHHTQHEPARATTRHDSAHVSLLGLNRSEP